MPEQKNDLTATQPDGLTSQEVQARRARGLNNPAPPASGRSYRQIIVENVFTFINIILFGLAIALVLVGRPKDALVSVLVISSNILISVAQEIRAKRKLDQIALLARPKATVMREGKEQQVGPEELVIGDVLSARPGDQIILDGKIVQGKMMVDESQLTGESNLVAKKQEDPVYSGSFCSSGSARYVVEKVGQQSLMNQIAAGAKAFRRVYTPLQSHINLVLRIMLLVVGYLELLLVIEAIVRRTNLGQSIANSTIIAGLVPNGLFLSISVAYALGALRIARSGALVQQANAIESLSNVDILCLDKTGTLTTNELKLEKVIALGMAKEALEQVLGVMAASAAGGDKTSQTIAQAFPAKSCQPCAEVAFSSELKWSALAFDRCSIDSGEPLHGVYALGAPEMLKQNLSADGYPEDQVQQFAREGLRVLLAACSPEPDGLVTGDHPGLPEDMQPLGLVVLSDVLRPEARSTLDAFREAGVTVKVISGDNPDTVAALARQAGLGPEIQAISGQQLEKMGPEEFGRAAERHNVFGRIRPKQKERLIQAMRDQGHYVAMTGDGVNDVLALKKANLAISMESGSQATRAVADLILLKDTFGVLPEAVREGQRIVNGMQDILKLFMARILSMALLIVSAMVIGQFPLAVRQVSLIAFFAVAIPATMLAVWAHPGRVASLGPRLARFVITPTLITALIGLLLFFGVLDERAIQQVGGLPSTLSAADQAALNEMRAYAQTALALFLAVVGLLLIVFVEPPTRWWTGGDVLSGDKRPALLAFGLMLALVLVEALPAGRDFFDLRLLDPLDFALVAVACLAWLLLVRLVWRQRWLERFLGIRWQKIGL